MTLFWARNIATFKIDLQSVDGNAAKAETSFFKINGNASPIDPTELAIIKARKKPNAVATRALMNAGTGHKSCSATQKTLRTESKICLAKSTKACSGRSSRPQLTGR